MGKCSSAALRMNETKFFVYERVMLRRVGSSTRNCLRLSNARCNAQSVLSLCDGKQKQRFRESVLNVVGAAVHLVVNVDVDDGG
jgi:hypothetical protein